MKNLGVIIVSMLTAATVWAQAGFTDLGVAAPVAESRGVVALQDAAGHSLALVLALDMSPRGYILVIDIDSGKTEQVYYPEGVPNEPAFASMYSTNGRFYTGSGKVLLEFDPNTRQFLFHGIPNNDTGCFVGEAFADGPDGLIYAGTYPNCHLVSYNPQTHEMKDYGQLDPAEEYFTYLTFDSAGWAYAGIGTARCNIVAFNPNTGEKRQIVDEAERQQGTATVFTGVDGKAYGIAGSQYYRMFEGKAEKIAETEAAKRAPTGAIGWGTSSRVLPDGRTVSITLPDSYFEVSGPNAPKRRLPIEYNSGGASLTSITLGPGNKVYTSSCHPMHLSIYDPANSTLTDLGPVNRVGGGNFCAMATQGQYLAAASYSLGIFHIYDTKRAFNGGYGDDPNPREAAVWSRDICRPRTCLAHPDGEHVLMAGFAGYGLVGGGLGIYNLKTNEATLITHENLIPDESTICLKALPDGNLVGGTSIEAPGGGHPTAKEATLYILDWKTRKVVFRCSPVLGASEIISLAIGPDGLVYGLASGSKLFVFDPATRKVVHTADLATYGGVPREALFVGPGAKVYAALGNAIVTLAPKTYIITKLTDAPMGISAGFALTGGKLYFASNARLFSYELPR